MFPSKTFTPRALREKLHAGARENIDKREIKDNTGQWGNEAGWAEFPKANMSGRGNRSYYCLARQIIFCTVYTLR